MDPDHFYRLAEGTDYSAQDLAPLGPALEAAGFVRPEQQRAFIRECHGNYLSVLGLTAFLHDLGRSREDERAASS